MAAFTSLSAVTVIGPGEERQLPQMSAHHTMIVGVDGTLSRLVVLLQGSHDGTTWTDIGSVANPSGGIVTVVNHLVQYVRAYLSDYQGSNAVTATIASENG